MKISKKRFEEMVSEKMNEPDTRKASGFLGNLAKYNIIKRQLKEELLRNGVEISDS
jgi:hypothetical protein